MQSVTLFQCVVILYFGLAFVAAECPHGWTANGRSCYFIRKAHSTWVDGRVLCEAVGGHLVEIEDEAENIFLTKFMNDSGVDRAWIGLEDIVVEGEFVWTTSQEIAEFTNWNVGEPNNVGGIENCVFIRYDGVWVDGDCDRQAHVHLFSSLCEAEARGGSIIG